MKKILQIIMAIFIVKLILNFIINEIIIINDKNGIYNTTLIKTLYPLNFYEPYLVYYNEGNLLYKKENFDEAIKKYTKSLKLNPPENKICDIRVNLSLAMLKTITEENKWDILEKAKNNLFYDNCASPKDELKKSEKANNLKKEIEKLESQNNSETENKNNNEKSIEEKLKESQKKASISRDEEIKSSENLENYEYYSGKKW